MIRVKIDYSPRLTKGEQQLLLLPNRLQNLRPVMQGSVAPVMNAMLKEHWDSKGAAFGKKWEPWALATLRKRIAKGNVSQGLLRDTDHLFRAIFRARSTDDRLKVIAGGLRLQLNVGVPRAKFHQFGTKYMPARQVIPDPLPLSFRRKVRAVIRDFILSGRITRDQ